MGPVGPRTHRRAQPLLQLFKKRIFFLSDAATVYILNRKGDEKKRGPAKERRVYPCATIIGSLGKSR